jgi:hypothetical protein
VPSVGRFASADTIVPDPTNPQSYNRYSYVLNNPLNLADPTGHCSQDIQFLDTQICTTIYDVDDANSLLEAIDAYLYVYERDPIEFFEAIGIAGLVSGEVTEDTISKAVREAVPAISETVAGWIGVLATGILSSAESGHNAHVSLYHFRDMLSEAIDVWENTERDDLNMSIDINNSLGTLGSTVFSIGVQSLDEVTYSPHSIFWDNRKVEGWGNDFHGLMENLLVDTNDKIGISVLKRTWWRDYRL